MDTESFINLLNSSDTIKGTFDFTSDSMDALMDLDIEAQTGFL